MDADLAEWVCHASESMEPIRETSAFVPTESDQKQNFEALALLSAGGGAGTVQGEHPRARKQIEGET